MYRIENLGMFGGWQKVAERETLEEAIKEVEGNENADKYRIIKVVARFKRKYELQMEGE